MNQENHNSSIKLNTLSHMTDTAKWLRGWEGLVLCTSQVIGREDRLQNDLVYRAGG